MKISADWLNRPPFQALAVFVTALVFMAIGWLLKVGGIMTDDPLFAWSIGAAFMLLFAMANSLGSIRADSFGKYWGASVYSYIGLAIGTGLAARSFSGIPVSEAGSYRWIYFVVTIGFLVFLSLVNIIKRIVKFAEREEWNEPKKRRR